MKNNFTIQVIFKNFNNLQPLKPTLDSSTNLSVYLYSIHTITFFISILQSMFVNKLMMTMNLHLTTLLYNYSTLQYCYVTT